jgi:hypothetical protein
LVGDLTALPGFRRPLVDRPSLLLPLSLMEVQAVTMSLPAKIVNFLSELSEFYKNSLEEKTRNQSHC